MTLGNWFKNYVYIPLGGNRKGMVRTILNLGIVWILTAFWHGASYNYLLWGLTIFLLIVIEKVILKKFLDKHKFWGHIYMIILIPLTWAIFAINDLETLKILFGKLFSCNSGLLENDYLKYIGMYGCFIFVGILFSTRLPERIFLRKKTTYMQLVLLILVFWISIYYVYVGLNNPFLYFSF